MPLKGLSFRQGVVVGTIMAAELERALATTPPEASVAQSFDMGVAFFHQKVLEYTGRVVPEFPQGIPKEALEVTDEVICALSLAKVL